MEALTHLAHGFAVLLQLKYFGFCLAGVLVGQIIGALPGIGPSAAIAILLPLTFGGDATGSIIMFAGIYYGAQYGGTLTSILVSIPGESSTVMTSLDGYQMARKGRAGAALGIAAIGSRTPSPALTNSGWISSAGRSVVSRTISRRTPVRLRRRMRIAGNPIAQQSRSSVGLGLVRARPPSARG